MYKYVLLLLLAGCADPKYQIGDCAKTFILGDKLKILQVNDFTYFYAIPPSTHVLIARHDALERVSYKIKCEEK